MGVQENSNTHGGWRTRDELHFINHLGQWTFGVFLGQRVELLRRYRTGLELRADWSGLNKEMVIRETERAIARELNRQLRESFS